MNMVLNIEAEYKEWNHALDVLALINCGMVGHNWILAENVFHPGYIPFSAMSVKDSLTYSVRSFT